MKHGVTEFTEVLSQELCVLCASVFRNSLTGDWFQIRAGILVGGVESQRSWILPLQGQLGLAVDATYVLPPESAAVPYMREAWNLSVGVVWTPGRRFGAQRDYYRPLLDVAHNGSFLSKLLN